MPITFTMQNIAGLGVDPVSIEGRDHFVLSFNDGVNQVQVLVPEDAAKNLVKMIEGKPVIQTPPRPGIVLP